MLLYNLYLYYSILVYSLPIGEGVFLLDKNRMIHKNDEIKRRFLQVDKLLLENPMYENLSDGAILTWSILRDRMELSKKNADVYSDEDGYLFLIFTDEELAEIIHRTRKTANARKKELEKFGLLYNVRMGNQEPNRIYLLEPETCDPVEYITNRYREKKKIEYVEKKAARDNTQMKKYLMIDITDENSYPQAESLGAVMMGKKGTSVMSKKGTSGCVKKVHPDGQNLGTNDTKINKTEINETYKNIEEEESRGKKAEIFKINAHFPLLIKEVLGSEDVYDNLMISRIILEMKKAEITFFTKKEMIDQHRKMLDKHNKGEEIWDWAKYFVGGIAQNRLSESTAVAENRSIEARKFIEYSKKVKDTKVPDMPFYNWLES